MGLSRNKSIGIAVIGCTALAVLFFRIGLVGQGGAFSKPESDLAKTNRLLLTLQTDVTTLRREVGDLRRQLALTQTSTKRGGSDGLAVLSRVFTPSQAFHDDPFLGDSKADTLVMVFIDFQCIPCRLFYRTALKELRERVTNGASIKLVLRDFPLEKNRFAIPAAQLAHCAGEQSKYWEAFDLLFSSTEQLDSGEIEQIQSKLSGVDKRKLASCMGSTRYAAEIRKDTEDGLLLGAKGAPGTFVGRRTSDGTFSGVFIRGAQPFEVIQSEVDRLADVASH